MGHEEIQVYTVKLRGAFMAYCDAFCFAFRSLSLFLELVQVQQEVFQEAGGESLTGCLETTMRCSCQSSGFEEVGSDKSCGSNAGRLRLKRWLARSVWQSGLEKPWPSSARGTLPIFPAYLIGGRYPFQRKCGNFVLGYYANVVSLRAD